MTAKERLKLLATKQDRLAKQVKSAQDALYKLLLESLDKIETNPAYVEQVFAAFNKSEGVQLVTTLAQDMGSIATANYSYFLAFADELDLSQKDFSAIKKTVDSFIQDRIGLSGNKVIKDSFLDSVLSDPTVKQKVKQQAYANLMSGEGATAFRKSLKSTVIGEQGKLGALESHYNTYVYDTYNQVDSALQEQYSTELGLEAFVYEGGVIATTRTFCRKYNGKIVLKSEALKNWPNELTTGKPKSYSPLSDRGGYSCRHSLNFVSARRAMRMRDDLELSPDGNLRVKSTAKAQPKEIQDLGLDIDNRLFDTLKDTKVKTIVDDGIEAYYADSEVTIGRRKLEGETDYYKKNVIYHEYGHAIHEQLRISDRFRAAPDFLENFESSQKLLKPDIRVELHSDLQYLRKRTYTSKDRMGTANAKLESLYDDLLKEVSDPDDIKHMIDNTADIIGALTKEKAGWGHSKAYYKDSGLDRAEYFAHASESYFQKNAVAAKMIPDIHRLMLEYFETVINKTHGRY